MTMSFLMRCLMEFKPGLELGFGRGFGVRGDGGLAARWNVVVKLMGVAAASVIIVHMMHRGWIFRPGGSSRPRNSRLRSYFARALGT